MDDEYIFNESETGQRMAIKPKQPAALKPARGNRKAALEKLRKQTEKQTAAARGEKTGIAKAIEQSAGTPKKKRGRPKGSKNKKPSLKRIKKGTKNVALSINNQNLAKGLGQLPPSPYPSTGTAPIPTGPGVPVVFTTTTTGMGAVSAPNPPAKNPGPPKKSELEQQEKDVKEIVSKIKTTNKNRDKLAQDISSSDSILGQDDTKILLEVAIKKDQPVLLVGDTGCGKTSIIRGMAKERGQKWIRFNMTGETTVDEFVGKYVLQNKQTVWEDGILLQAMKQGAWLIVDEVNVALPEILFVLHSLLDDDKFVVVANHQSEVVRPHKDFKFFGTMNPVDEYAGTKELNKAFKSRFGMIINMGYPERNVENIIVEKKAKVSQKTAMTIVDVGNHLRQLKIKNEIFYTCSTRDLLQWGHLVDELGLQTAFEVAVLNKADGDAPKVKQTYKTIVGTYDDIEKKRPHQFNYVELQKEAESLEKLHAGIKKQADFLRKEVIQEELTHLNEKLKKI